jgi:hypothetical protein
MNTANDLAIDAGDDLFGGWFEEGEQEVFPEAPAVEGTSGRGARVGVFVAVSATIIVTLAIAIARHV